MSHRHNARFAEHSKGSSPFKSAKFARALYLRFGVGFLTGLFLTNPTGGKDKEPGPRHEPVVESERGKKKNPSPTVGTLENPLIDISMTREEALEGVHPDCPKEVLENQELFSVKYYSLTGEIHQGQLVMDRRLVQEIKEIFDLALKLKFPFHTVIPISHPSFRKNGRWDDDLSMEANNTSGFNYRRPTGGGPVSKKGHAMGFAIDINPMQNPYIKGKKILPPGSRYDGSQAGTLTADHPIVKRLLELGWTWGGKWRSVKDYQHFQKTPAKIKK